MTQHQTFTAGEVATITSVNTNTQLAWRSRGFLPTGDGKWTRFTLRDLCRLRLLKVFTEEGLSVGQSVEHLTEVFLDHLEGQLRSKLTEPGADPLYSEILAVIARGREGFKYSIAFDHRDLDEFKHGEVFDYTSLLVINLAALGRQMAEKMAEVVAGRTELADIDRRTAVLDEEMAKRGL